MLFEDLLNPVVGRIVVVVICLVECLAYPVDDPREAELFLAVFLDPSLGLLSGPLLLVEDIGLDRCGSLTLQTANDSLDTIVFVTDVDSPK